MSQEQLFASFVLDSSQGMEIALNAEYVTEATHIQQPLQKLPGSVDFLEGFMHLRKDVIPVINLKKRLGLSDQTYSGDAKVAVVSLFNSRYGLLFEDIKEVFRAKLDIIRPINQALLTEDRIVSALIQLEPGKRAVELLDLNVLFNNDYKGIDDLQVQQKGADEAVLPTTYSRYVIFKTGDQEYGITVDVAQEITFCTEIDEMFKTGIIAGAIELRGRTIGIMNSRSFLNNSSYDEMILGEESRILVLSFDTCKVGLIVDEVKEILTVADDSILPFPFKNSGNVKGMLSRVGQQDIILLNIQELVRSHRDTLKSVANLGNNGHGIEFEEEQENERTRHHLITENCYLIFSIDKNFAIELKDVNEILENVDVMHIPGVDGHTAEVINLRGEVVPVVDLRQFYLIEGEQDDHLRKLIICSAHGQTVALGVDQIVTIYKQEQFYPTPSLGRQFSGKRDTLDRLIEYRNGQDINEHVLVLNVHSLIRNHLQFETGDAQTFEPDSNTDTEKISKWDKE